MAVMRRQPSYHPATRADPRLRRPGVDRIRPGGGSGARPRPRWWLFPAERRDGDRRLQRLLDYDHERDGEQPADLPEPRGAGSEHREAEHGEAEAAHPGE